MLPISTFTHTDVFIPTCINAYILYASTHTHEGRSIWEPLNCTKKLRLNLMNNNAKYFFQILSVF